MTVICSSSDPQQLRALLTVFDPLTIRGVISFGVAGGLDPTLKSGDVVMATEVLAGDTRWLAGLALNEGMIASVGLGRRRVVRGRLAGVEQVVAARAAELGFRRLGILGTRYLVDGEVYPEKLTARGLGYLRPNTAERAEINRIIFEELVAGVFRPEAVAYFQRVMGRMKDEGVDAVVLGCTEIPLIMNDANSPLPTLDSTRLLARAALQRAAHPAAVR